MTPITKHKSKFRNLLAGLTKMVQRLARPERVKEGPFLRIITKIRLILDENLPSW